MRPPKPGQLKPLVSPPQAVLGVYVVVGRGHQHLGTAEEATLAPQVKDVQGFSMIFT